MVRHDVERRGVFACPSRGISTTKYIREPQQSAAESVVAVIMMVVSKEFEGSEVTHVIDEHGVDVDVDMDVEGVDVMVDADSRGGVLY